MKVAIEGCAHGELEKIYDTIEFLEKKENIKVDLLLCCGDFQSVRNEADLLCMAVPPKYRQMCSFYKYYSGEKTAPIPTIFIGGNHEASNYLAELPYGGWVCPNIYYLGYAGVVNFGGVRIAGMSGIYKHHDYKKGHFEKPPFGQDTVRSIYHVRNLEVFRLKQIKQHLDIVMSHDWPRKVYSYGNTDELLRKKRFLKQEVESKQLGNPAAEELLHALKPSYWFSAHLHVKFPAVIQHTTDSEDDDDDSACVDNGKIKKAKITKFLALDKCLPYRDFLQVIDIPSKTDGPNELMYDEEWIAILKSTNHLLRTTSQAMNMPFPGLQERWDFTATEEELKAVREDCKENFMIPENFEKTAPAYDTQQAPDSRRARMPQGCVNPQTTRFCQTFKVTDPNAVNCGKGQKGRQTPKKTDNPDEIMLDDDESDDSSDSSSDIESSDVTTDDMTTTDPPSDVPLDASSDEVKKSEEDTTTEVSSSSSPSYATDGTSGTLTESSVPDEPLPDVRRTADDELCHKGPKRFKRRNQAIYEQREEDSDN